MICLREEPDHTSSTLMGMGGNNETCLGKDIGEEVDAAMDIALEPMGMEDGGTEDGNIPADQQKISVCQRIEGF